MPLSAPVTSATAGEQSLPRPYLLFLGDVAEPAYAKTANGLRDWAGGHCVGEFGCGATVSTGLPFMTPAQARGAGARAMVIGVANPGGCIPPQWRPFLLQALEAGLDLVRGMHAPIADIAALQHAAAPPRRRRIDLRPPPPRPRTASRRRRSRKRLPTVGT